MARTEVPFPPFGGIDETFHVELAAGEWMACPCSTKAAIYGPVTVEVRRYRDGGVEIDGEAGREFHRHDI